MVRYIVVSHKCQNLISEIKVQLSSNSLFGAFLIVSVTSIFFQSWRFGSVGDDVLEQ